jgi:hypothetical protein
VRESTGGVAGAIAGRVLRGGAASTSAATDGGTSHFVTKAMLSFTGSLKVWVCVNPCDMRRGFEGLAALVSEQLKENLRRGALFVFCNKRHTRLNVLYFDGSGLWLMTKSHAPQCAYWFVFENPLSISCAFREGM